ncbi:MAG: archaetidylserine decarboxylase [Planctomycetaceae bacterium]
MKTRFEQTRQARRIHGGWCNLFGATLGVRLSRCPIPAALRPRVYRALYGSKYEALDEDDLEKPLHEFRSINELFTRGVRSERRPIADNAERQFIAPCDSTVQDIGRLRNDTILTVKDISYQISSLAPGTDVGDFHDGQFAILFLSPRDCHRVFSPQNGTLTAMTHVPGYRLLVHPPYQRPEFPVFTLNERLVMELTTPLGRCLLIMIAGWGVGHITHPFPSKLKPHPRNIRRIELESPRLLQAGDWLATFELGSTVVLITEGDCPVQQSVHCGDTLRYGESLFSEDNVDEAS